MSESVIYELKNSKLQVSVSSFGAELKSVKRVMDNREYMWDARPEFWKRTSPVLFPLVGGLNNGSYTYNGKSYMMSQHGFARDMEFTLVEKSDSKLLFALEDTEETLEKYPFKFRLEIGYELSDNNLNVSWNVFNKNDEKMYFSIGGHPAFLCPIEDGKKQTDYIIKFDVNDSVTASMLGNGGLLTDKETKYSLDNGKLAITENLFDNDALVIEKNQAHKVSLCYADGSPYLTVDFDAPLFGIWSPPKKNAPFICIEPWYGRCDRENFSGDLSEREWGNALEAGENFKTSYNIIAE